MSGGSKTTTTATECCADGSRWVFGYGSLIWNPGFKHIEARPALLHGYHRRFCLYSVRYRGTQDFPGLVLGLDRGGCCWGRAFRVTAADWPEAIAYLDHREIGPANNSWDSYERQQVTLRLRGGTAPVTGQTYVINRDNPRYTNSLTDDEIVARIARAVGPNGPNVDYLLSTVEGLQAMNLKDRQLSKLLAKVRTYAEA